MVEQGQRGRVAVPRVLRADKRDHECEHDRERRSARKYPHQAPPLLLHAPRARPPPVGRRSAPRGRAAMIISVHIQSLAFARRMENRRLLFSGVRAADPQSSNLSRRIKPAAAMQPVRRAATGAVSFVVHIVYHLCCGKSITESTVSDPQMRQFGKIFQLKIAVLSANGALAANKKLPQWKKWFRCGRS